MLGTVQKQGEKSVLFLNGVALTEGVLHSGLSFAVMRVTYMFGHGVGKVLFISVIFFVFQSLKVGNVGIVFLFDILILLQPS